LPTSGAFIRGFVLDFDDVNAAWFLAEPRARPLPMVSRQWQIIAAMEVTL